MILAGMHRTKSSRAASFVCIGRFFVLVDKPCRTISPIGFPPEHPLQKSATGMSFNNRSRNAATVFWSASVGLRQYIGSAPRPASTDPVLVKLPLAMSAIDLGDTPAIE